MGLPGTEGAKPLSYPFRFTTSEAKPKRRVGVPRVCRTYDAPELDATGPESRLFGQVDCSSDMRAAAFLDLAVFVRMNPGANVSRPDVLIEPVKLCAFQLQFRGL